MGREMSRPIELTRLCAGMCEAHPELVFWKHLHSGLKGQGDLDAIAPQPQVAAISRTAIRLVFDRLRGVRGVVVCRHARGVTPHFVVADTRYPHVLQLDISWWPVRLGYPWCDPAKLAEFAELNDSGIRVLRAGPQAAVLVMLYGVNRDGAKPRREADVRDILSGAATDARGAHEFVEGVAPIPIRAALHDVLQGLESGTWDAGRTRRLWRKLFLTALRFHLVQGVRHWQSLARARRPPACSMPRLVHVQNRRATQQGWAEFLCDHARDGHEVVRSAP